MKKSSTIPAKKMFLENTGKFYNNIIQQEIKARNRGSTGKSYGAMTGQKQSSQHTKISRRTSRNPN